MFYFLVGFVNCNAHNFATNNNTLNCSIPRTMGQLHISAYKKQKQGACITLIICHNIPNPIDDCIYLFSKDEIIFMDTDK